MRNVGALKLVPVWVNPNHLAMSARILMDGHRLHALGVKDGEKFLGIVSRDRISTFSDHSTINSAVEPAPVAFDAESPVREVARQFVELGLEYAPVLRDGVFIGVLTPLMLLQELDQSFDPLTQLSWSDRLREWGEEELKSGNEITIIFIDLDNFGSFNKRYGHVVGDRVLRTLAAALRSCVDTQRDILVRYGGDEFAIGTRAHFEDAEELAQELKRCASGITLDGIDEPISFSVGMYGGRRTKERENVHYAATLDNLINLASRNCMANKSTAPPPKEKVPEPAVEKTSVAGVVIEGIKAEESPYSITEVSVSEGGEVASGVHARGGGSQLASVAEATARALEKLATDRRLRIVSVDDAENPQRVLVRALLEVRGASRGVLGEAAVRTSPVEAAAEATITAFTSA